MEIETDKLDKEMRLDRKRKLESHWKKRRDHRDSMRWAKEWVLEVVLEQRGVEHECGMSEACLAWMCEEMIEERIAQLNAKDKDNPEEDPEEPAISTHAEGCSNLTGGGELRECQPGNAKPRHTGTLQTPKQEKIFNKQLAPKHQAKLPTQN